REAEEAKKAKEAEKLAQKLTEIEERLKEVESICGELKAGKVGTKEAIQKLSDISERIPE
ncbi:MAG: hypothetical protein ACE5LA_07435, partial [Dehalococcoidales bacterium]